MTWEEKLAALQCLSECSLNMRRPGDWYLVAPIEIGGRGVLLSPNCSESTPEAAVESMWRQYTVDLPPDRYLVIGAFTEARRNLRWNGFMWWDISAHEALEMLCDEVTG